MSIRDSWASSRVCRLYLSGVVCRSQASPVIPAVPSHEMMESICSVALGDLHASARRSESTASRLVLIRFTLFSYAKDQIVVADHFTFRAHRLRNGLRPGASRLRAKPYPAAAGAP